MPRELDLLVVSIGGAGDAYPVLAMAIKLKEKGHRVRFVANARFEPLAVGHGLDFIGFPRSERLMVFGSLPVGPRDPRNGHTFLAVPILVP